MIAFYILEMKVEGTHGHMFKSISFPSGHPLSCWPRLIVAGSWRWRVEGGALLSASLTQGDSLAAGPESVR